MKLEIKKTLVLDGEMVSADDAEREILSKMKVRIDQIFYDDSSSTPEEIFEEISLCVDYYKPFFETIKNFKTEQEKISSDGTICSTCTYNKSTCPISMVLLGDGNCHYFSKPRKY